MATRSRVGRARRIASVAFMILVLAGRGAADDDSARAEEPAVRAAFLYNFLKFAQWPCEEHPGGCGELVIGVLGDEAFAAVLENLVAAKTVRGHELRVLRLGGVDALRPVHLLFVGSGADDGEVLHRVERQAVLTVGESERFTESGGAIRLFVDSRRMRFEINPAAAKRQGVHISPDLLVLARIVD